jgi:hypothetical protein
MNGPRIARRTCTETARACSRIRPRHDRRPHAVEAAVQIGAVRDILIAYWTRDVESNCRLWFRSLLRHRNIGAGGGRPVVDHGVGVSASIFGGGADARGVC